MSKPILTEEEADQELAEAVGRYDEQRPGLGHDFLDAIDKVLLRISSFPKSGAPVPKAPTNLPVRRVPVKRFPSRRSRASNLYLDLLLLHGPEHRLP